MSAHRLLDAIRGALRTHAGVDRREFLKLAGITGGGFVLAAVAPRGVFASEGTEKLVASAELNAFVHVSSDGKITIYSANPEMGQGVKTTLPMIIAEEMGADWRDVEVVQAPVDEARFGRQGAGGSTTVPRTWNQMREMGATAREMFISAGALVMEVPREELHAESSKVVHTSGRFKTFAELATLASRQPAPEPGTLIFKERADYTIIGRAVSGVDNLAITTGQALFGIDTRVEDMLYAAYEKCPAIGGKVVSANVDEIRAMPGIVDAFLLRGNGDVRELLDGVAIVGRTTWHVFQAKKQLKVKWDESAASKDSWAELVTRATAGAGTRGEADVYAKGDVDTRFAAAGNRTLEAFYEYPFVSHFTLEPMNCSAHYRKGQNGAKDTVELWIPTQFPAGAHAAAKSMFGFEPDQVTVHQMRLGGSFGRRVYSEYICESMKISERVGRPVKLTWMREDDLRHDFYRVGGFQKVKAAIDAEGRLVAFENHHFGMKRDGEVVSGSGFRENEFPVQNIADALISNTWFDIGTPCGPWRAPRSNTNAFVMQTFLAEVAHTAGRDYVDFLLELLGEPRWLEEGNAWALHTGRAAGVIREAAKAAGWGRNLPAGRGLGFAFYFCHAAHVAEVAEVSVDAKKHVTVHKVTVAVDVGPIINRSGALSQVEGAVIDGLSTMMGQKITMEGGRIQQSNFHDYRILRMPSAPPVDIHFIESDFAPTGLGEPALPPLAPAVCNAIFAATGERIRKMPLADLGYTI
ncbi:MAG: xanthine dehydrogenase family protein molybdopterin-binding subunit [Pseudomonadales bacterium]|nr:xanthine dehydrogenase family protein molybdopterin-binding subunit [Pseudomonadales bacterium]MCP5183098.1 xanthine dehydrogenase family protein molybdopterin-binding subunit [Pseudomonadales bacterium]